MLDDPVGALVRAAEAGIELIVSVVDVAEHPERTFELLPAWCAEAAERLSAAGEGRAVPEVRLVVGSHPHNAKSFDAATRAVVRESAARPEVGGIGETGLDYFYDLSPRDAQREAYRESLGMAQELGLAAVVHLRDAHEEGLGILRETGVPAAGCVIHCFTEGPELAARFLALGCYISFAGPLTFKRSEAIRRAALEVPLSRIIVETDSPFLTPEPYRGHQNEPALSVITAQRLAELKGVTLAEIEAASLANARRLFGSERP